MRILVVSNVYPPDAVGGYEVACHGVVEHLADRHETFVLTSRRGGDLRSSDRVFRELPWMPARISDVPRAPQAARAAATIMRERIAMLRPDLVFVWNAACIPESAIRVAEESGVPVAYSIMEHWFGRQYRIDQFTKFLIDPQPDIPRRAWACGVQVWNRSVSSLRLDFAARPVVGVIWNAQFMRDANPQPAAATLGLGRVIPLGSPRDIEFSNLPRRTDSPPTLLFAGRVVPDKGPDLLIRALAEIAPSYADARAVFAGPAADESYLDELKSLGRSLGVSDRIEFTGQLSASELGASISRSSVLVIPSRWPEPAPLMAVEGAFARIPIVAARAGGIPEQFEDRHEVLLFDVDDTSHLARCLIETLSDPAETSARVEAARRRAENYRFSHYARKVEEFLVEFQELQASAREKSA